MRDIESACTFPFVVPLPVIAKNAGDRFFVRVKLGTKRDDAQAVAVMTASPGVDTALATAYACVELGRIVW